MGFGLIKDGDPESLIKYMQKKAKNNDMILDIVDYGIASRFGNIIVLNKNLAKYKKYCLNVFNHELRHSNKVSKTDLVMDTIEGSLLTNLYFCLRNPRGFSQFLPVGIYNKKIYVDINLIVVYLIIVLAFYGYFSIS